MTTQKIMTHIIEIRTYNLKPGTREAFHALVIEKSLPMLELWQVDVVAYGASLHDADSYYLIRSYASVDELQQSEDAFYGSAEWREGPREGIIALIDSYASAVIEVDEATLRGLRGG